jgi:hypothetical protein
VGVVAAFPFQPNPDVPQANTGCTQQWTVVTSPNPGTGDNILYDVAAISPNDVWAVGYYYTSGAVANRTLTMHWDGAEWSSVPSPNHSFDTYNVLYALTALSTTDIWAVGHYYGGGQSAQTLIIHWDGSQWSIIPSPNVGSQFNYLYDIEAVASNDIWAVGSYDPETLNPRTFAIHWNGTEWTTIPTPNLGSGYNYLSGIEPISANDIWAVGHESQGGVTQVLIAHWDGLQWTLLPSPNSGVLSDVTAIATDDIWAVGQYADSGLTKTLTMHWDGSQWSVVPSPNVSTSVNVLEKVSAVAGDDIWAIGWHYYSGTLDQTLAMHWNGTQWSLAPSPNAGVADVLLGVDTSATDNVWAVGRTKTSAQSQRKTLIERYVKECATQTPTVASTPSSATQTNTPTSTPTPCSPNVYSDVPLDHPFYQFVTCLSQQGVISGYSDCTFRPENNITRGQIAKVVSNAAGFDEDPGAQIYEDVPTDVTFYAWINRLSMRGHMGGYPCGLVAEEPCVLPGNRPYFRPNQTATRGQLAKIVSNAAGSGGIPTGIFYTDVQEDHPFYIWIMRLTELGVMSGYDCGGEGEPCDGGNRPYFRPYNNVTRGQASKIVANTFFADCQTP